MVEAVSAGANLSEDVSLNPSASGEPGSSGPEATKRAHVRRGGERLTPSSRPYVVDIADLRGRSLPPVILVLACSSIIAAWLYLPGLDFRWRQFLICLIAFVFAAVAWRLRRLGVATAVWLVVSAYALAVASVLLRLSVVPLLALEFSIVLAVASAWPWAPLLASLGASMSYLALNGWLLPQPGIASALYFYLLTGAVLCLSMHSTHQILRWSWERHVQAHRLAEQLRDRQQQLNSTVQALDLAYRLLQRTSHELSVARQEAEEARRLKEQFAANISHELRTPLNIILGFSEMMYMSPHIYGDMEWTPPLRRDISQVYAASQHLLQLVDDVLDLSRLNAEVMPLRKQLCDLNQLVREAVSTARDLVRGRELALETDLDITLPQLYIDETRIREVILNLLNNAIRFTEAGKITVRTWRREQDVLISVQDTGVGIGEEELERIFDEFYQADALSRQHGGTGLGLAISKRFVQMHNGRIWAESELGKGATFYVSLPLGEVPAISRLRTSRPLPTPRNPYGDSIVLLGQQPDVVRLLQRHLGDVEVLQAGTWEQAKEMAMARHCRAIVRNFSLMEAKEFLGSAVPHDLPAGMPVLFSSIPSASWRAELMGVYGSLQKPVRAEDVIALLRAIGKGSQGGDRSTEAKSRAVHDVLIIDDDRGFVQMLARLLGSSAEGYRVRWAYSGQEGLEEMRRSRPDALILDLVMPDLTGTAVLAAMRAEGLSAIPTIVITALDMEEDLGGFPVGCVGLAQRQGWGVDDTIAALRGLLERAKPAYD